MRFPRRSGILMHPTSLPGRFGIGDLGDAAYEFVDYLASAGQSYWQVLPLSPTGYGDSPYQGLSAFAGNPMLISPEKLLQLGHLSESDLEDTPSLEFKVQVIVIVPCPDQVSVRAHPADGAHGEREPPTIDSSHCVRWAFFLFGRRIDGVRSSLTRSICQPDHRRSGERNSGLK